MVTLDLNKLKDQLVEHEGVKYSAYQDSEGFWTIGIGHLIDSRKHGTIDHDTVMYIFHKDVSDKINDLDRELPWWRTLNEPRQRVLVDMCFNLGIYGLLGFKNTLKHAKAGEFKESAQCMLESRWAEQVGRRAVKLAKTWETGED